MKKIILVLLSLTLIFAFTGCSGTTSQDQANEDETFSFAMSGLYKPFNFKDKDGKLVGFDVEIGKEIAKRMGMKAEPVTNPWETILMGLTSGKYDAIIGSMAITEDRKKQADFSRPYYRSGAQIFVDGDNAEIKSVDDVKGKAIGVVKNSTFGAEAKKLTDIVQEYDSDLTALQDLASGRIDAVITDQMVGFRVMKEGTLNIKDIGEPLWLDEMAIPVNKGNTELLNKINKALDDMINDGTYEKISTKWFGRSILGE
ncbi:MAG: ABC transporter substrate-binding protein [Tepidibacillus sp.]|uniref:ABC transporter substrate-binding protein n=1 Tax=Tepidibacillus sp. HK-1 TaxID=1883407 RepID=UPI000852B271|nr:ABC transporter substrate-binding protein [Tepidibacillus sp. HK-1]GBF11190.1 cystine-binding periplasmic protein precursor [Tepidibacillus sp. HK-1]